jgi:uncharacterized protein involved in exopolysaccharide biosynthesis
MRSRQEVFPSFPAFDVPATVQQPWPSIDSSMNDNFALAGYFRIIWNHRWLISAITMAVFLATLFGTIRQKPVFRATGSLQIDLPKGSVASLGELFQDQAAPDGYMQTQAEILRGSAIVSLLIAKIEPTDASMSPSLESVQEHLESFKSRLSTEVVKGSHLIQVDFESESAEQSAATVNQLMAIYIDQTRVQRSQTAQNASSWLLDQLNQTKQKLEQATSSLQRYENDHQLLFVQTADGGLQSIETQRLRNFSRISPPPKGFASKKDPRTSKPNPAMRLFLKALFWTGCSQKRLNSSRSFRSWMQNSAPTFQRSSRFRIN